MLTRQRTMQQTNHNQPALLRCLSSLDLDTWAQVLLPRLIAQVSAGNVALTCIQLRDLCFGAVQHIDLSSVHDSSDSSAVEDLVHGIPQHFTGCESVALHLDDEDSYCTTPRLLPALARLPKLQFVNVKVKGDLPRPSAMAMVLHSLRTQLSGRMRSLHLDVHQCWAGAAQVWRELGRHTGLTELALSFTKDVEQPLGQQDLLPLANLHSLEDLEINIRSQDFFQPLLSAELANGLTALTTLYLSKCNVSCLQHVSSCVALRELIIGCPDGLEEELGESEWAAVGELVGLVDLQLYNAKLLSSTDKYCAAVGKLTRLQSIGAAVWSVDMLPALAPCTLLTRLAGEWQKGSSDVASIVLPSVVELADACGFPPFAAMPNLVTVRQSSSLAPDAFADMARHCTGLQQLIVSDSPRWPNSSLPPGELPSVHIAAVKALSALTGLTRLDFMLGAPDELCALVDVVGTLLPHGFQHLEVCVPHPSGISHMQLNRVMLLAKWHALPRLVLDCDSDSGFEILKDARALLSALSGVDYVTFCAPAHHAALCMIVYSQLREDGLSCPKQFSVSS